MHSCREPPQPNSNTLQMLLSHLHRQRVASRPLANAHRFHIWLPIFHAHPIHVVLIPGCGLGQVVIVGTIDALHREGSEGGVAAQTVGILRTQKLIYSLDVGV